MNRATRVFEPIEINGMKLKNRLGLAPLLNMPGVWTTFTVTDETIKWFEARAKGGAGLIMTGTFAPPMLQIPGAQDRFAEMADVVHAYGTKLGVQIGAGGVMLGVGPSLPPYPDKDHAKESFFEIITGKFSPFPDVTGVTEFTVEQIEQHVKDFAAAAAMLKEAGVDCVELHCAHGGATLYCSFISPFYNRREDEYGGNWENRLRFPTDTIKKMRESRWKTASTSLFRRWKKREWTASTSLRGRFCTPPRASRYPCTTPEAASLSTPRPSRKSPRPP
jgi:2-enoate reductase